MEHYKLESNDLVRKGALCQLRDSIENLNQRKLSEFEKTNHSHALDEHIAYQKCMFFLEYCFADIWEGSKPVYRGKHVLQFLDMIRIEMKHCTMTNQYHDTFNYSTHLKVYEAVLNMVENVFVNHCNLRKNKILQWEEKQIGGNRHEKESSKIG